MKQIYPDLWQTNPEHPVPQLTTHAYLLVRNKGNVLFYSSGHWDEYQHFQELSGLIRQYASPRHRQANLRVIDKQATDNIVHQHRCGEADRFARKPLDAGA